MESNGNGHGNNNTNASCMMMENGLYSMIMIPPLSHQHHQHQHHQHQQHQHQSHNSHHDNNTHNNNNNKVCCCSSSACSSSVAAAAAAASGCYDLHHHHHHQLMGMENQTQNVNNSSSSTGNIKAKIMSHPHYPRLLSAYVSCQKVGAPPEVVARLEEAETMAMSHGGGGRSGGGYIGEDPALDQFMEAYCEMLTKYEQELTKPFKEAMLFLSRIECQFKALTLSSPSDNSLSSACGEVPDRNGSPEEDIDVNNNYIDPSAEDRELKGQLLRKYSGYLGSLRQEFLKKRKKGKLPKEARQQLLDWWSRHYKWPYPSESQKLALAESTGLDQKQINNWFINQRKRHWKPSEDMQFVVMDAAAHSHAHSHYGYMDNVLGNPFPMDVSPTLM